MSPFVECDLAGHGSAILEIFNHAIATSTALYDYEPRPPESMTSWFAAKAAGNFPVIGLESPAGELMGFATYGSFRPQAAYHRTVEHSVYVHHQFRGQGLGKRLLLEILERAKQQSYHLAIGVIDAQNAASIHLHKSLGFTHAGTLRQAGYKFDRWLDVDLYQRILKQEDSSPFSREIS